MTRRREYSAAQLQTLPVCVASAGYVGLLPLAPGTWGSLVALPLYLVARFLPLPQYLLFVVALAFVGVWAAGETEKILGHKDPGIVVIDEVAGMLLCLAAAPSALYAPAVAFVLFRFFDIVKPFPLRWLERRIAGGWGVMADDLAAGLYAWICLRFFFSLLP